MVMVMQLNIQKHYFYELIGISNIKAHIEKLNNLQMTASKVSGEIEINVSYTDVQGMECFKVLPFPFDLDLESLNVVDVNLAKTNVAVVEGQGLDVEYILVISYFPIELDKEVELTPITENVDIVSMDEKNPLKLDEKTVEAEALDKKILLEPKEETVETEVLDEKKCEVKDELSKETPSEETIEKIKEDISKNYEDKLADSLSVRENKVISTKTHQTTENFLSFFDENVGGYYALKCIYVEKEEDLNKLAKEYHVSLEKLLAGYDRENHKVLFSLD